MRKLPGRRIATAIVLWVVVASALVWVLNPDQYLIGNDPDGDAFWFTSNIDTRYHVMNSIEGINVIGVVLILTIGTHWPMGRNNRIISPGDRDAVENAPPAAAIPSRLR
jgi:hypothetical protein